MLIPLSHPATPGVQKKKKRAKERRKGVLGKEEKGEFAFFLIFLDILCLFVVYMSTLNGTFYRIRPYWSVVMGVFVCFILNTLDKI